MTTPAPQGQTYSASYVGDRASIPLNEIVLTVKLADGNGYSLQNVHAQFDAIVNPKDLAVASVYEVNDIVRRLEPRIRARVTDLGPVGKPMIFQELSAMEEQIAQTAATTFSEAYSRWAKAQAFDVQIVVALFYLTDLLMGSSARSRFNW